MPDPNLRTPNPRGSRRSIRLKGYDYRQPGTYFVTIVTRDRAAILGQLSPNGVQLTALGQRVARAIRAMPRRFPNASAETFVVMPDHVHVLIVIDPPPQQTRRTRGTGRGEAAAPTPSIPPRSITAASPAPVASATHGRIEKSDVERSRFRAREGEAAVDGSQGHGAAGDAAASPLRDGRSDVDGTGPTDDGDRVDEVVLGPGNTNPNGPRGTVPGSVGAIVQRLKAQVTRWHHAEGGAGTVWQRGYDEHVVRSDGELKRICAYILDNPRRAWERLGGLR